MKPHRVPAPPLHGGHHLVNGHVIGGSDDVDPGLPVNDPGAGSQGQDDGLARLIHVDVGQVDHNGRRHPAQIVGAPQDGGEPAVTLRTEFLFRLQARAQGNAAAIERGR